MPASYSKAAIPEPHVLLGQRLKPFCLGHYLILDRFDSPFVAETPRPVTRGDLVFAVTVCCHTPQEFFDFIESDHAAADIEKWGKSIGLFDVASKAKAFSVYLEEGSKMPRFWNEQRQDDKPTGTHWSQAMILVLTGHCGYSLNEAMTAPFGQAVNDYLRYCETQGAVRLMTPEEVQLIHGS